MWGSSQGIYIYRLLHFTPSQFQHFVSDIDLFSSACHGCSLQLVSSRTSNRSFQAWMQISCCISPLVNEPLLVSSCLLMLFNGLKFKIYAHAESGPPAFPVSVTECTVPRPTIWMYGINVDAHYRTWVTVELLAQHARRELRIVTAECGTHLGLLACSEQRCFLCFEMDGLLLGSSLPTLYRTLCDHIKYRILYIVHHVCQDCPFMGFPCLTCFCCAWRVHRWPQVRCN